ncbi:MAG: metal-dependent hydrolase [Planctomycetota bacterium]|jgi:inner membrane protein
MGLLAGAFLLVLPGFRRVGRITLIAALVGALTHAPLDLCTSYGTKVYWPFSYENATIDLFPIIDPLFTLVLLTCLVVAALRRSRRPALVAAGFLVLYTGLALHQRSAARDAQALLARSRGHEPVRARVMPLPASLLAWRSLYEVDGRMVADLVRPLPAGETRVIEGGSVPILRTSELPSPAREAERVRSVLGRFSIFADGWTATLPDDAGAIGDMRFSLDAGFRPPWALRRSADEPPVAWEPRMFAETDTSGLLEVILGTSVRLRPLETVAAGEP